MPAAREERHIRIWPSACRAEPVDPKSCQKIVMGFNAPRLKSLRLFLSCLRSDASSDATLIKAKEILVGHAKWGALGVGRACDLDKRRCHGCIGETGEIAARGSRSWRNDAVSKGCQPDSLETRARRAGHAPTPCVVAIH